MFKKIFKFTYENLNGKLIYYPLSIRLPFYPAPLPFYIRFFCFVGIFLLHCRCPSSRCLTKICQNLKTFHKFTLELSILSLNVFLSEILGALLTKWQNVEAFAPDKGSPMGSQECWPSSGVDTNKFLLACLVLNIAIFMLLSIMSTGSCPALRLQCCWLLTDF